MVLLVNTGMCLPPSVCSKGCVFERLKANKYGLKQNISLDKYIYCVIYIILTWTGVIGNVLEKILHSQH